MFMLHNLFEMNEYFIMNKKNMLFLLRDVSSPSFTAAKAFSVCLFLSHSLTQLGHRLLLSVLVL